MWESIFASYTRTARAAAPVKSGSGKRRVNMEGRHGNAVRNGEFGSSVKGVQRNTIHSEDKAACAG